MNLVEQRKALLTRSTLREPEVESTRDLPLSVSGVIFSPSMLANSKAGMALPRSSLGGLGAGPQYAARSSSLGISIWNAASATGSLNFAGEISEQRQIADRTAIGLLARGLKLAIGKSIRRST